MESSIMKFGLTTLTILLALSLVFGCRKKNTAGLGGNNELRIKARHHTIVLDSIKVYVKFNATDAPTSLSEYDISADVKIQNGDTVAIFEGLKDGEYYLYGTGWDPYSVIDVEGGLPIEIDKENSPIEYNLQVTEQH